MHGRNSVITVYGKMFKVENFHGFRGFSLNCECFPMNYGLVDWQCKSTSMLPQANNNFHPKREGFTPRVFCLYGIYSSDLLATCLC